MIIPSDQIGDFGKVKARFLKLSNNLNDVLPYSVEVINYSDSNYIDWLIENNIIGWWSKVGYTVYRLAFWPKHQFHTYTFYFHNINDAALFKLFHANDCSIEV